jgi:hypothetical protein
MKYLYTVKIKTEIVVAAESPAEAEASPLRRLPGEWDENCCPYGDGTSRSRRWSRKAPARIASRSD